LEGLDRKSIINFIVRMHCIIVILLFIVSVQSDPKPSGGANCTHDFECNSGFGGKCQDGVCECPRCLGNPDCSYKRISSNVAGGLELFGLVGAGGIGSYILGSNGYGFGETLFGLGIALMWIVIICFIVKYHREGKDKQTPPENMWMFCGHNYAMYIYLGICIPWAIIGFTWIMSRSGMMFGGMVPDYNNYATC
jgi:hypothetical protein